ncbi:MAG: bifunctional pyr operon transcriptional regulator/uracil phosphoribosyltransferase PyrR [Myxococcota bacterium]
MTPRRLMDAAAIERALAQMAEGLHARPGEGPFAVVGIRRGGEPLAARLAEKLAALRGQDVPVGVVDITLYRDDGFGQRTWPEVGVTDLPFDLAAYTVALVDDVLFTGRTVRAALGAILDYGRPRAVRLAVLVDRGLRELPVAPDVVGMVVETHAQQHVQVHLVASGAAADEVVLQDAAQRGVTDAERTPSGH